MENKARCQNEQPVHRTHQLYMSPQTENLNQMYLLADKLLDQLQENRAQKQNLLSNIDKLSSRLTRESSERGTSAVRENDMALFSRFLGTRGINIEGDLRDNRDNRDITTLTRQNEELKRLLQTKVIYNEKTMGLLQSHEEGLTEIVSMLRDDVFKYYSTFVERVRNKINAEVIPSEDAEFALYLDNVNDIQKLMDISAVYRALLRLYDS